MSPEDTSQAAGDKTPSPEQQHRFNVMLSDSLLHQLARQLVKELDIPHDRLDFVESLLSEKVADIRAYYSRD